MGRNPLKQENPNYSAPLWGDVYQEQPIYNMTGLYYTILADVIRACFMASINLDIDKYLVAVKDLLDISAPVFLKREVASKLKEYREKMDRIEIELESVRVFSPQRKQEVVKRIFSNISEIRRLVLITLAPILITTTRVLTPEGAIREATGAGNGY